MPREYTARNGQTRIAPYFEDIPPDEQEDAGWCLACGDVTETEPDTRKDECGCCGERCVYGFAELVLMGLVRSAPDGDVAPAG